MDVTSFKAKVTDELGKKNHMVLSTSSNDRVTSRSVSTIFMNGKIYFQTDIELLKYIQIAQNPRVSLCEFDMQIEGIAKILGHPLLEENKDFFHAFSEKHKGSFEKYTFMPNEVVIEITPKLIEMWAYEDDRPYVYNLNMETDEFSRKDYPMNHIMKLDEKPFNMINSDTKHYEYRLNDERRRLLRVGDTITFFKRPEEIEFITVLVEELKYYSDLLLMYTGTFDELKDRYKTPQEVVDDTKYYTDEEIKQYGCVAIKMKRI